MRLSNGFTGFNQYGFPYRGGDMAIVQPYFMLVHKYYQHEMVTGIKISPGHVA